MLVDDQLFKRCGESFVNDVIPVQQVQLYGESGLCETFEVVVRYIYAIKVDGRPFQFICATR